jgi:ATP-dependent Lhr-like helicase
MPWKLLSGYTAPVQLWETEIFPARLSTYRPGLLDAELGAGRLVWFGAGEGRIALCVPEDLDVVLPASGGEGCLFGDADRPRDFWELRDAARSAKASSPTADAASDPASQTPIENSACVGALWSEVWAGRLSSDTWESLRRGLLDDFGKKLASGESELLAAAQTKPHSYPSPFGPRRRLPRALKAKWRDGPPVAGLWFSLAAEGTFVPDSLDEEELDRERVRLLLGRWGVLCRSLLEREEPLLSWSGLLPAMRRMELAGELTSGRFFSGLPGLQFAGPGIVEELDACDTENGVYWMNAADPASLCGLSAEGLDPELPARSATSRLCFAGNRLVAISRKNGKDLRVLVPPDDPRSPEILGFMKGSRTRAVDPERKLVVEKVNGANASTSPWAGHLRSLGFEEDRGRMVLW